MQPPSHLRVTSREVSTPSYSGLPGWRSLKVNSARSWAPRGCRSPAGARPAGGKRGTQAAGGATVCGQQQRQISAASRVAGGDKNQATSLARPHAPPSCMPVGLWLPRGLMPPDAMRSSASKKTSSPTGWTPAHKTPPPASQPGCSSGSAVSAAPATHARSLRKHQLRWDAALLLIADPNPHLRCCWPGTGSWGSAGQPAGPRFPATPARCALQARQGQGPGRVQGSRSG